MADLGREFLNTIKKSDERKTQPFDSVGTVTRVKDGVAYVHFAGGVDETPVKLTINAQAGDEVQVRVADGRAWLVGNATRPPTDDAQARRAINLGKQANDAAVKATKDAMVAHEAAESASAFAKEAKDLAESVEGIAQHAEEVAEGVEAIAERAETSAGEAKTAADTAFINLSQVQSVLEVAEWIATHGTYTKATTFNPNATYYTVTATQVASPSDDDKDSDGVLIYYEESSGVYTRTTDISVQSGKTYYTVTGTPVVGAKAEDVAQYYTLAVTEAMADYIKSHLALMDDGLYVMKDGSLWKLRIADNGVYILNPQGKSVNTMTVDGNVVGYEDAERIQITSGGLSAFNTDNVKFFDVDYDGGVYTNRIYFEGFPRFADYYSAPRDEVTTLLNVGSNKPDSIYEKMGKNFTPVISGELQVSDVSYGRIIKNWRDTININVVASEEEEGAVHFETQDVPISYGTTETVYSFTADLTTINSDILHTLYYKIKVYFSDDSWYMKTTIEINQVAGTDITYSYRIYQDIETDFYRDITTHAPALTFGVDSGSTKGNFTSKFGEFLATEYPNQTAIGKYNDNQSDNAFEIGNGTGVNNRSNAFAVDWDGNVKAQGWAGFVQMFAGSTAPNGWLFCDGSEVAVADYPLLHAVIGNTYGTPSDSDHFVLPDLGGRFPIGANTPYPIGDTGGSADAIVPYHSHSVSAVTNAITGGSHHHATYRKKNAGSGSAIYVPDGGSTTNGISTTDTTHTHNLPAHNTNSVGTSGEEVGANIPPYLGINFIICTGETS